MASAADESRVSTVYAAYIVPIPFIVISTALRLFVKMQKGASRGLTLDDYLITFAATCAIGELTSGLVYGMCNGTRGSTNGGTDTCDTGPPNGFGKHISTLSMHDVRTFFKGDYIFSHFYNVALGSIKLAILAFYYRIFVIPGFQRVVLASMTFIALWIVAIEVILGLQCRPVERFWDSRVDGSCFNLVAFSYFTNISNLVTDLWIFFLPVPVIFGLQTTTRRKIGLSCVFLIGLATCGISAARLEHVVAQGSLDFTWDGVPLGAYSALEPLGGILCANLPVIYKLFASNVQKWSSSFASSRKHTGGSSGVPLAQENVSSWVLLREKGDSSAPVVFPNSIAKTSISRVDGTMEYNGGPIPDDTVFVRQEFRGDVSHSAV